MSQPSSGRSSFLKRSLRGGWSDGSFRERVCKVGVVSVILILYSIMALRLTLSGYSSINPFAETPFTVSSAAPTRHDTRPSNAHTYRNSSENGQKMLSSAGGVRMRDDGLNVGDSLVTRDGAVSMGKVAKSSQFFVHNNAATAKSELHKGLRGKSSRTKSPDRSVISGVKNTIGLSRRRDRHESSGSHGGDSDGDKKVSFGLGEGQVTGAEQGKMSTPPMEGPFDVTLVSQTSKNRFWMLPFLCQRWGGPISIALLEEDKNELPQDLCTRMVISSTWAESADELDPERYPVNRLRNIAVDAVSTSHFLMTDIDIWPDVEAYEGLRNRYNLERELVEDAYSAIVFTAFSRRRFCDMNKCAEYARDVPQTVQDLKLCLDTNTCGRFDSSNLSGQGTAFVYYWRSMLRKPSDRILEHIPCFKSHRFEPYLVVRKSPVLPRFDERFVGYGKNKIQWVNHLRYSGFSFFVMPMHFVIHAPHPKSAAKSTWERMKKQGKKPMDAVFERFMSEISKAVDPEVIKTDLCRSKGK